MSRFFFNVRMDDDRLIEDEEGILFPDLDRVRHELVLGARERLKEAIDKDEAIGKEQIEVTNGAGWLVAVYPIRNAIRLG